MMSAFAANNQRCQVEAVSQNGPDPKRELIEPPPATDDPDYEIARQLTNLPKVDREVTALFEWFGFSDLTVPVKGLFEDTLRKSGAGPIAVLQLDGDWYSSVRVRLDELWDRVSPVA